MKYKKIAYVVLVVILVSLYICCINLIELSATSAEKIHSLETRLIKAETDISVSKENDKVLNQQNQDLNIKLEESKWIYKGNFRVSAYGSDCDGCSGITKGKTTPEINRTVATDPDVIPTGYKVRFGGRDYIAEDTGGAIKGKRIDLFVGTEAISDDYGIQYFDVWIKEGEIENE